MEVISSVRRLAKLPIELVSLIVVVLLISRYTHYLIFISDLISRHIDY